MKIEIEDIDPCTKNVKVCIPHQVYRQKVDAYLHQIDKEVKIPGFRKGKVPKSILEKMFGQNAKKEVMTQLISESLQTAIEEKGVKAAGLPANINVQAEEGTDINVSAQVEVFPAIEIKDYTNIEIKMKIIKVSDGDVEKVIEHYHNRAAKSNPVTNRSTKDKDFLKIDFKGTIDGTPFKGGDAKGHILQVGTKQFVEGFEEQLIGMNIGDARNIQIKMPENYPNKEIAGKIVKFNVILQGIQEKQLPELNDEFARSADVERKFENLADMRIKLRQRLEEEELNSAKKQAKKQLTEKLAEIHPMDVPETLIKEQIRYMVKRAKNEQAQVGGFEKDPRENSTISAEEESTYREPAIKLLQQEIIIKRLTEDLGIEVNDNELDREIKSFLKIMGTNNPKKMQKDFKKDGTVDRLRDRMLREKTLDKLMDTIRVKEEMVDREKVIADN